MSMLPSWVNVWSSILLHYNVQAHLHARAKSESEIVYVWSLELPSFPYENVPTFK